MDITERIGNFGLLRDRLSAAEDKNALMQLEMVRMNALEEFRELTKLGNTITMNGVTFDVVKRHSMSVEEKEMVVFELGWACLKEIKIEARDTYFDHDITLHRLGNMPHCALLHVIAMIENVTDGNGEPQIVTPRCNFILEDDINGVFQGLVTKLSLFYPKIPIGKVEVLKTNEKPSSLPESGIERFNYLREMLSSNEPQVRNFAYHGLVSYLQDTTCYLLSPVLPEDKMKQMAAVQNKHKDNGHTLLDDLLKSGLLIPMTTTNPQGERRLAVFLTKDQIPPENAGMIQFGIDFKLACIVAKAGSGINAIVIDYSSPKSITLSSEMIDDVLGAKVELKRKDEATTPSQASQPQQVSANSQVGQQSAQWEKQGLCKYCGGIMAGLFTKKCKSCGKTKK